MAKVYSGVDYIDVLLSSSGELTTPVNSWSTASTVGGSVSLTYDFMISAPGSAPAGGFQIFSSAQRTGAENAMALFAEVANITFSRQLAGTADIELGTVSFGGTMFGYTAGEAHTQWTIIGNPAVNTYYTHADVYLTNSFLSTSTQTSGSDGFSTMMHEIGHALGLTHTFNNVPAPSGTDSEQYSIMAYNEHPDMDANPSTPLLYDIAALQYLYGANTSTRTGNDTYSWATNEAVIMAIWDAGGTDTISASNQSRDAVINLNAGSFSSIGSNGSGGNAVENIAIAYGASIENAVGGSGDDTLTGNSGNNTLTGNGGDDTINGGGGADFLNGGSGTNSLAGGSGNDKYRIYSSADTIVEDAGAGSDRIYTSVNYGLANGVYVELFTTSSSTGTSNINLTGNALSQTIVGNAGQNFISAGGAGGSDLLRGLGGNDKYRVYNSGETIIETSGGGSDRVYSSADYQLASGVSIETLTTSSSTGTSDIDLIGNSLSQVIVGNAGDNYLSDGGAGGSDLLRGLAGDDRYRVYNAADTIIETAGGGNDRVYTSVNYQLGSGVAIELFTTSSSGGSTNLAMTGNKLSQTIIGNAGDNTISAGGTGGVDVLRGLGGNDRYRVYNAGDQIIENNNGGTDRVLSSVDYALSAGVDVETLSTNSGAGTSAIDLTGNELSQVLIGNSGNNRLDGKLGADTLRSIGGSDTFVFSSALGGSNVDEIVDFNVASDLIELDSVIFTALTAGSLSASAFRANTTGVASDSNDRIIYDTNSGELYYDADGTGVNAATQFATIGTGLSLSADDFDIV